MDDDVHVIKGIGAIVNSENIKPGINIKDIEDNFINGGILQQKDKEPQDKYKDELKMYADKLGIDFSDILDEPVKRENSRPSTNVTNNIFGARIDSDDSDSESDSEDDDYANENDYSGGASYTNNYFNDSNTTNNSNTTNSNNSNSNTTNSNTTNSNSNTTIDNRPVQPKFFARGDTELKMRTQEQLRRQHIDSIIGTNADSVVSFEKEKYEDEKCMMLEQIDSLIGCLTQDGADLSRMPVVDKDSPYSDVEKVYKMLRHKNDRARYCNLAEEFLLFGAITMEELFDGKRVWLGRYQPDLTNWNRQVDAKLRRMRHDTSTLVNDIMSDYNIGPGARILLELLPNMFLHSHTRKKQTSKEQVFTDSMMMKANERLRDD